MQRVVFQPRVNSDAAGRRALEGVESDPDDERGNALTVDGEPSRSFRRYQLFRQRAGNVSNGTIGSGSARVGFGMYGQLSRLRHEEGSSEAALYPMHSNLRLARERAEAIA